MRLFKQKTPPPSPLAMTMVDMLANINMEDDKPDAHLQIDKLHEELGDRITHADFRDGELTKRIDFLLEERRQVRAVRDALHAARVSVANTSPEVSEGALAAELAINYGN